MLTVHQIIAGPDGSAAVSRETGIPLTTVEGWKEVKFVPPRRQPVLIDLAKRLGRRLSRVDFPPASARRPRSRRAAA